MADDPRDAARGRLPLEWSPRPTILVAHGSASARKEIERRLSQLPCESRAVSDRAAAERILDRRPVDVIVTELSAPSIQGLAILELARSRNPEAGGILLIRPEEEQRATEALSRGVVDFQSPPYNLIKLQATVERLLERQRLVGDLSRVTQQLDQRFSFPNLIGDSPALAQVRAWLKEVAPTELHALLVGEEGTGKRLVAGMLHHNSRRRNGVLLDLRCSALPPRQLARELFGTPSSGSRARRPGRLERASEGTLFLDDLTHLPIDLQERVADLLRTRLLRPAIDGEAIDIRPRIVAACETDPRGLVESGRLDEGLVEILAEARLELPPLRFRRRDIVPLARHFLSEIEREQDRPIRFFREVLDRLEAYDWPGNVSELRQVVRELADLGSVRGRIEEQDLPEAFREAPAGQGLRDLPPGVTLADLERRAIERTLRLCDGNREKAARMLGIGVRTLYRKLKSYQTD